MISVRPREHGFLQEKGVRRIAVRWRDDISRRNDGKRELRLPEKGVSSLMQKQLQRAPKRVAARHY